MAQLTKREALRELWRRGHLSFLLDSTQKELYELFYNTNHKVQTWLLSRRQGKTYTLCVLAIEQCIRKPNSIVKFVSPTKLQVTNNIRPLLKQILEDCPEEIKPLFKNQTYIYYFPNGSEIQLAGTDNQHAEKLRGGDSHIAIVDEAGSCNDLDNLVKSILLPTTLITKGKIILASTPPKESDHDFLRYIEEGEERGSLIKKTIDDNPRITQEQRDELIAELGGLNSDECRRELFCEIVKDAKTSVLPEFTPELEKEIVKEWIKPPFLDGYVAMDIAFKDLTAVLFAYYDFRLDKVIIEDELSFQFNEQDNHLAELAKQILDKEDALWKNPLTGETKAPYMRVSDINMIATNELRKVSNNRLMFLNTRKDDKDSAINNLRVMLANKKIIINPKCKTLIRHLRNVKWMSINNKSTFARSPDDSHYDFVDAAIYLCRSISYTKNPYPSGYDLDLKQMNYVDHKEIYSNRDPMETYRRIFNVKRR